MYVWTGSDYLYGNSLDNVFDGLGGYDEFFSGDGNDTFIFNSGYGILSIYEQGYSNSDNDKILFGEGIISSDIEVSRHGDNLDITINGTSDNISIKNHFINDPDYSYQVEVLEFSNGETILTSDYDNLTEIIEEPPANNDPTAIVGTTGNDMLDGNAEDNIIDGMGGFDNAYGYDGDDTYIFNSGYSNLYIWEYGNSFSVNDKILFGDGISFEDLDVNRQGDNLSINITTTGDTINIGNYYVDDPNTNFKVENLEFSNGDIISTNIYDNIVLPINITGTTGSDMLNDNQLDNIIDGLGGYDEFFTGDGNDTYIFHLNYGHASIYEQGYSNSDNDKILFGEGITSADLDVTRYESDLNITITTNGDSISIKNYFINDPFYNYQVESLEFFDGEVISTSIYDNLTMPINITGTVGDDSLFANSLNNTIDGLGGFDNSYGNDGDDTYIFNSGYSQLNIWDYGTSSSYNDRLLFGEGIESSDLILSRIDNNLVIKLSGTTDQVNIGNHFIDDPYFDYKVEVIEFSNGETLFTSNYNDLEINVDLYFGSNADDNMVGTSNYDVFLSTAGNDILSGQEGSDTYLIANGNGNDIINEVDVEGDDFDEIEFEDAQYDSLWLAINQNDDLEITNLESQEVTTVTNWTHGDTIELICAGDREIESQQMDQLIQAMAGFNPPTSALSELGTQEEQDIRDVMNSAWTPLI